MVYCTSSMQPNLPKYCIRARSKLYTEISLSGMSMVLLWRVIVIKDQVTFVVLSWEIRRQTQELWEKSILFPFFIPYCKKDRSLEKREAYVEFFGQTALDKQ